MATYYFLAIEKNGQEKKGVINAENEREARHLLRQQSLMPIRLTACASHSHEKHLTGLIHPFLNFFTKRKRLSSKVLALFTRQFSTLLSAGLPIEEALAAVAEQTESAHVKGLILAVRNKVVSGYSLAAALSEYPLAFSELFVSTIGAGEKSGHLDKVLSRLADYTEQQWQMRQKLKNALIYPSMIVLVAFSIVGFLLEYVVPKMVAVYVHMKQSLPSMTQVLISLSHFIKEDGLLVLGVMILALFFWRRALKKSARLREKYHWFLLSLPFIGYTLKTADTARFARTLSILSASGVSVLEAMTISAKLIASLPIKAALKNAVAHVREGAAIHLALKQTEFFSPMSVHMIASGEASGQLENMLERVADHQENEITRLIEVSLALFEPAIILVMGAIVLFIVLAVLLPIFQLNQFAG